ncbi:MAG: HEAT repeat domain-containing protein [Planctomycetia bacterium]|nr:HEAT repeat domain-containing protein [Planctomycetia bacterium]
MAGKGLSPVVTAAVAAVALAAGAVGGALFERGRAPAARDVAPAASQAPAESPASPAAADPQAATPAVPGPSASPEPELAASRAEIARLRQRVTDLEALVPKEKSKEDRIALAKEMVECIRRGKKDTEAFRRMLSLLNELCPEMGPYFLERSADPEEKAERSTLFVLAMSAGGPEVAEEVLRRLTGSDEDQRLQTLNVLGGGAREVFSIRNLPVSGPLANLGLQYASTGNDAERRAAAGLLGGVDSIESRTALYRMAATDSETAVKEQAVRSLGQVGDRETLAWLDSYQPSLEGLRDWEKQRLQASIDGAREQLKKKYP